MENWNVGDVIKNADLLAGETIIDSSLRCKYIWESCKIVEKTGKILGTDINTYKVVDNCGETFALDDNDLEDNKNGGLKTNSRWYLALQAMRELNDVLTINRKTYMSICYVLTQNGAETGFDFKEGSYGNPFSVLAKKGARALVKANLLTETRSEGKFMLSVPDDVVIPKDRFSDTEQLALKKTVQYFKEL